MCGITGFLGRTGVERGDALAILRRMTGALQHRGPDGEGYWQSPDGVAHLGHRRLAIIDLSPTGQQPMVSPDGRWVICFNGEIYNYRELRAELAAAGARFTGSSDTEVLLQSLIHWGLEPALRRLNGMFAFALWDGLERRLSLARDRIGEKPLYYSAAAGRFLFGSELKALRQHPAFVPAIDRGALALYLRYNHVPAPHCIYEQTCKLPAGHFLVVRPGAPVPEPQPYWRAATLFEPREVLRLAPDDPALVDGVESALRSSVALRMVADVPLGALLSGGIDSSLIVALMQAQSSRPVKTYTIGYAGSPFNEAEEAAKIARHLGTEHHEYDVSSAETLGVVGRLPEIYDEPFADSSQIPTHLVSVFARKHVTVALSGDAGDELFAGYNRYLWSARTWPRLASLPLPLRQALRWMVERASPSAWTGLIDGLNRMLPMRFRVRGGGDKLYKLALAAGARTPEELYLSLVSIWPEPALLTPGVPEPFSLPVAPPPLPAHLHFVERMMYYDLLGCLPDDMLCKVDRASMATSLEIRVPFLDNEVVRLAWNIPFATHTHRGTGKWLLRRVLARHVPPALFERPKMGFGVPIRDWLRGPLRDWAEDLLAESRLRREGYLDPVPVRQTWSEHLSGRHNHQHRLWGILMFEAWLAATL